MNWLNLIPKQAWYLTAALAFLFILWEVRGCQKYEEWKLRIATAPVRIDTFYIPQATIHGEARVISHKRPVERLIVKDTVSQILVDSLESVISTLSAPRDIQIESPEIGLLTVHYDPFDFRPPTYDWERPPERRIIETKIILEARPWWELPVAVVAGIAAGYVGARALK